jgi:hypothetical protein
LTDSLQMAVVLSEKLSGEFHIGEGHFSLVIGHARSLPHCGRFLSKIALEARASGVDRMDGDPPV